MLSDEEFKWVEQRVAPMGFDMLWWGAGCGFLYWQRLVLSTGSGTYAGMTTATLLLGIMLMVAVLELLFGISPGKLLFGWQLRSPDGHRPATLRLVLRGAARLLPVALFLAGFRIEDTLVQMGIIFAAVTAAICQLPACYVTIVRRRQSLFDFISGAIAVKSQKPVAAFRPKNR